MKKYSQTINFNYNPDIDKNDAIEKTAIKEQIVKFLKTSNEISAAKFVENELLAPEKMSNQTSDHDLLDETKKISELNKKILDKLIQIENDLIDEQDTSIHGNKNGSTNDKSKKFGFGGQTSNFNTYDLDFGSFLSNLLGAGVGAAVLYKFLKDIYKDYKNKQDGKLSESEEKAKLQTEEKIKAIEEEKVKLEERIKAETDEKIKTQLNAELEKFKADQQKLIDEKIKLQLKVPSAGSVAEEASGISKFFSSSLEAVEEAAVVAKVSALTSIKSTGGKVFNALGKIAPWVMVADVASNVYNDAGDYTERFKSGDYTGLALNAADNLAELDPTSLISFIPYIGEDLAKFAGFEHGRGFLSSMSKRALEKHDERLPKEISDKLKKTDTDLIQTGENLLYSTDSIIEKYKNMDIVETNILNKSTVKNASWGKVNKLNLNELEELYSSDNLLSTDRDAIKGIIDLKRKQQINPISKKEEEKTQKLSTANLTFSDTEALSYSVIGTKNDLEEFILANPFTSENSVEVKKKDKNKEWIELQYKDKELNSEYVRLKMQYDDEYSKFVELRRQQIKALSDYKEVDGEVLSSDEYSRFRSLKQGDKNFGNVSGFVHDTRISEASKTTEDLIEKYKNIQIPSDKIPLMDRMIGSEGFDEVARWDVKGYTIGHGHQIKPGEEYLLHKKITKDEAYALFKKDFEEYSYAAEKIPGYSETPKVAQDALIDMTYNMGKGWYLKWPTLVEHLKNKEYSKIADLIRHTKYASQVQGRAFQNAKRFDLAQENTNTNKNIPETKKDSVQSIASSEVNTPNTSNDQSAQTQGKKLNSDDAENSKTKSIIATEQNNNKLVGVEKTIINNNVGINNNTNQIHNAQTQVKADSSEEETTLFNTFVL